MDDEEQAFRDVLEHRIGTADPDTAAGGPTMNGEDGTGDGIGPDGSEVHIGGHQLGKNYSIGDGGGGGGGGGGGDGIAMTSVQSARHAAANEFFDEAGGAHTEVGGTAPTHFFQFDVI